MSRFNLSQLRGDARRILQSIENDTTERPDGRSFVLGHPGATMKRACHQARRRGWTCTCPLSDSGTVSQ